MCNQYILGDVIKSDLLKCKDICITAEGDSMLPLIRGNKDKIYLESVSEEDIRVGDILLFKFQNKLVLHRVASIYESAIRLRGDGNLNYYERCDFSFIVARVKSIKRGNLNIERNSFIWDIYKKLWPKYNTLRRFFLTLYKLLRRNNVQL